MKLDTIQNVLDTLQKTTQGMLEPAAELIIRKYGHSPFLTLIGCILSLRTRDTVSLPAACILFTHAQTPEQMIRMSQEELQHAIKTVNYYKNKAHVIHTISQILLEKYNGSVPSTLQDLMALPGVGLKTANLVLAQAFGIPAICVDTHVHRIANRLGWVTTKTPEATEPALKKIIPQEYWIVINNLFVMHGQNICQPITPKCSICPIKQWCARVGVTKSK